MANATTIYRYLAEGAYVKEMEAELQGENAGDERLSNRLSLSLQRLHSECARLETVQREEEDVVDKCEDIVEEMWTFDRCRLVRGLWVCRNPEQEVYRLTGDSNADRVATVMRGLFSEDWRPPIKCRTVESILLTIRIVAALTVVIWASTSPRSISAAKEVPAAFALMSMAGKVPKGWSSSWKEEDESSEKEEEEEEEGEEDASSSESSSEEEDASEEEEEERRRRRWGQLNEKLADLQATRAQLREKLDLLEGCVPTPIASSRSAT